MRRNSCRSITRCCRSVVRADGCGAARRARWSMPRAPNNTAFTMRMGNVDAVEPAFARAHHVTRLVAQQQPRSPPSRWSRAAASPNMIPAPAATRCTPARRICTGVRQTLAHQILHVPESRIRVIARDVGGGFGMKGQVYPEEAVLVWAARRVGRPVKWIPSRSEALARRQSGPRPECRRRAGARCGRQVPGVALEAACTMPAPISRARRIVPVAVVDEAGADRLRHPGGRGDQQPRLHQHRADHALSRRRPPRGGLHHGAPRRSGGARDAASTRPNCAGRI